MQKTQQQARWYWTSIALFVLAGCAVSVFIQLKFEQALAAGIAITDVSALARSLYLVENYANLVYIKRFDLCGLLALYAPGYLLSSWFYPVINGALLVTASLFYKKLFIDDAAMTGSFPVAVLGIVGNPYLLLTFPGPNKELPLLALTLALCWLMLRKPSGWLVYSIMAALLAAAFRDGYGALLLLLVVVFTAAERTPRPHVVALLASVALCAATVTLMHPLSEWLSFLHRNITVASTFSGQVPQVKPGISSSSVTVALLSLTDWLRRSVLNVVSLAIFPGIQQTNGQIYWLGIGYWLFGVANLFAFLAAAYTVLKTFLARNAPQSGRMAVFWIAAWLMISASLYVQPRYMMTMLPIGIGLLSTLPLRTRIVFCALVVALVVTKITLALAAGASLPLITPDTFPVNPYLLP
ncbi:hypothetical protein [Herbaspirillum sp. YR522]|uniref:hypothetical protein n=1 Tax=Herbaspirillum sp. YR522 TaxID=1144342 RepID=UPI00026F999D|nr:hypothetical protein [Herbaspirillum sp. YR522]EJN07937.1 hypothetical protein PMI40_01565 [Herbaspirillum sp. YR522]